MINFRNLFSTKAKKKIKINHLQLSQQVYKLAQINIHLLTKSGIKGIIIDLDNTIISEDDRYLSPLAEDWLNKAKLAGLNFFILSNGKRTYRVKYWSERLNIPAISPAKKPFSKSFKQAMDKMQLQSKQVLVIGDSFHTDVLGSWFVGCSCIQVATLPHPPRWWEKIAGKWVQKPYPNYSELENFYAHSDYNKFK